MDSLRLILLLIGAAVVLAVYLWTRYRQRPPSPPRQRAYPGEADSEHDDQAVEEELARMEQLVAEEDDQVPDTDRERLLVVSVVAPEGQHFGGEALLTAFHNNRLEYGEHDIFHRMSVQGGRQRSVYGVANLVKPGTFPQTDMAFFSTPGVTLFLQLPGPIDGLEAFDDFVTTAERLAVELGGTLKDERHCVVTHQRLMQLREQIAESRLRARMA
ncbi:MAG TPA: cell division protein ZipA [Gammaproteobacteria bacterium]|nr:cell division protein ZipA [Gammaproteobacteria bacterium]